MAQLLRDFAVDHSPANATPLRNAFNQLKSWVAERRLRIRTMHELQSLDQRSLHDLAISPTDFPAIAKGTWMR